MSRHFTDINSFPHKRRMWGLKSLSNLHKITNQVVNGRPGIKTKVFWIWNPSSRGQKAIHCFSFQFASERGVTCLSTCPFLLQMFSFLLSKKLRWCLRLSENVSKVTHWNCINTTFGKHKCLCYQGSLLLILEVPS